MKNLKLYTILLACALGLTSCLDKYPEDAIPADKALNTVSDADQAVIGIYSSFLSGALYSGNLTLLPDLQADLAYAVKGNTNVYGDVWRWNILATNSDITSVYAALYDVIGRCNFLLQNADNIRRNTVIDADLDRLDQYCGEAYFARALAYSELIKMFCKSYESDQEAKEELGVVLRSKYYSDEPLTRASLYDSYQFVLHDLDMAADLLELDEDYNPGIDGPLYNSPYFSEYTVYALRARVALYMKDYEDAIKYSTKIIDSKYFALSSASQYISKDVSYFRYMWTTDNSSEVIWKVGFTQTAYGAPLGQIFFNYDYRAFKPDYVPAQWVLNLYQGGDLRYDTYFVTKPTGFAHGLTWPLLAKYYGNSDFYEQTHMLHMCMPKVFRLAEQYLIRAEAYVQSDSHDYGKAAKDIVTLRAARYQSYGGGVSMGKNNAMQVIEEERVKELYMEGFRLMDLKRWHKGFKRTPQTETLENGNALRIEKDNALFVWPIPQHEIESQGSNIQPNESNK